MIIFVEAIFMTARSLMFKVIHEGLFILNEYIALDYLN
jgi:hypothetical protein